MKPYCKALLILLKVHTVSTH